MIFRLNDRLKETSLSRWLKKHYLEFEKSVFAEKLQVMLFKFQVMLFKFQVLLLGCCRGDALFCPARSGAGAGACREVPTKFCRSVQVPASQLVICVVKYYPSA